MCLQEPIPGVLTSKNSRQNDLAITAAASTRTHESKNVRRPYGGSHGDQAETVVARVFSRSPYAFARISWKEAATAAAAAAAIAQLSL